MIRSVGLAGAQLPMCRAPGATRPQAATLSCCRRPRTAAPAPVRAPPPRGSLSTLLGVSKNGTDAAVESLPAILQGLTAKFWHDVALETTVRDYTRFGGPDTEPVIQQPGPCYTTRAMAIVHIAMYDAFVTLTGDREPYGSHSGAPAFSGDELVRASNSAVAGAARAALCDLYSAQAPFVDQAAARFDASFGAVAQAKEWGERVAHALLKDRADDGFDACDALTEFPDPVPCDQFVHQPDPVMREGGAGQQQLYAVHWRFVRPFGFALPIKDAIPALPAPLATFDYPADFDKVRKVGADDGEARGDRTPKMSETGIFWAYDGEVNIGTPHRLFSGVIDAMVDAKGLRGGAELLFLYAATNVAMADGAIQAWEEKYRNNFWRPVVAIRAGSEDPDTPSVYGWTPLGAPKSNTNNPKYSPNFPAYPSGHATIGTSGMRTAEKILEFPEDLKFEFVSAEFNGENSESLEGPPRPFKPRWLTVDDAVNQNQLSRLYIGVHWTFDSTQGAVAGQHISEQIVANFPAKSSG